MLRNTLLLLTLLAPYLQNSPAPPVHGRSLGLPPIPGSFADDVHFLNQHHNRIHVLRNRDGASIAVWPGQQGRILTSSVSGDSGRGFGWINRDLIAPEKIAPHMNAVGGEDRIWLGPEGGQFSIFFAPKSPFDLDHWQTPTAFDAETFDVLSGTDTSLYLRKTLELTNYSGTHFRVQIDRAVQVLETQRVWEQLGLAPISGIQVVGFESNNKLTNLAATPWSKSTGLLSLWSLGQFQASPTATIVLPIHPGTESRLGKAVKTDYFGAVPADRIHIGSSAVFFKADANFRSKLGLNPRRARGMLGSYDAQNHVLTIVQYEDPGYAAATDYVNSAWELQKSPFSGDVANCYNDGPPGSGKPQMGRFYELESSSPAIALAPHDFVRHIQRTIHLVGAEQQLDPIAQRVLGVHLKDVAAFRSH